MSTGSYDVAQICSNGHIANDNFHRHPAHNKIFCEKCGSQTITTCQSCKSPIRGQYHVPGIPISKKLDSAPGFCHNCGKPYPWTEEKLKAAKELSGEFEELNPPDREILKTSLDDMVRDSPRTPVAAMKFKKTFAKLGKHAAAALRDIVVDIASESAKKIIWPD